MGDGNAPEEFGRTYEEGLDRWHDRMFATRLWGRKFTWASLSSLGQEGHERRLEADLGTTVFADDILKTHAIRFLGSFRPYISLNNRALSEELAVNGHSQNESKLEVQTILPKYSERWELKQKHPAIFHMNKLEVKYLGCMIETTGKFVAERRRRIAALDKAWFSLGAFWSSKVRD